MNKIKDMERNSELEAIAKAEQYHESQITLQDVDRYWKAQVRAVDRWEWLKEHNCPMSDVEQAYEEMEQWGKLAEEIQAEYHEQFGCQHKNLKSIGDNNPLNEGYICSDCGAWLDENGNVVRKPVDEIPY
jgi:hypothetical protein